MRFWIAIVVLMLSLGADSPHDTARRQFDGDKFGLMFHWGIYSLVGKGESMMETDSVPIAHYAKLAGQFNPSRFDAEAWVKAAKGAGARYVVFTAKSHDGFCMFDSKLTTFDVVDATPYAKDTLKALADACHRAGLRLVVYYSLLDWHHPDYFPLGETGKGASRPEAGEWSNYVAYYQGQIRELCTGYGPLAGLWLDGMTDRPNASWSLDATYKMIHELQPQALIGNNHHRTLNPGEDFRIFEQETSARSPTDDSLQETVVSLNKSWGYTTRDQTYKSSDDLIRLLVTTAAKGSNLLINVGVKPDGSLPAEAVERFTSLGQWMEANGESVRGTRPGAILPQPWGYSLTKADTIYLHVLNSADSVIIPAKYADCDIRLLGGTDRLTLTVNAQGVKIERPSQPKPAVDTIIVIRPMSDSIKPAGNRP